MRATAKTRKPIDQLTLEDLETFPIWEFAMDEEDKAGQDETWVRPVRSSKIPKNKFSMSVAASFRSASGDEYRGIVGVTTNGGIQFDSGAIIHAGMYIFVPTPQVFQAEAAYKNLASSLGQSQESLFPLSYTLLVPIDGEKVLRSGEFQQA